MASTRVTSQMILRKALPILHGKLSLIGNANRQYDNRFADAGASVAYGKIGPSLQVRLPVEPVWRDGAVANIQDTVEQTVALNVSQIGGADLNFADIDLSLSIDDFTERYIEPCMSVCASTLESRFAAAMYKQVYQFAGTPNTTPTTQDPFMAAKVLLNRSLCPQDRKRVIAIDSPTSRSMVTGLQNLYNPPDVIGKQYREGRITEGSGFQWYENDLLPVHVSGANGGSPVINGSGQSAAGNVTGTLNTRGWTVSTTVNQGTVFTIAGVYSVHPETKTAFTDQLQQFVIIPNPNVNTGTGLVDGNYTADSNGQIVLSINPGIVGPGAASTAGMQNVSALGVDNATISILTGAANTSYTQNLVFHKNAFAFVTADLEIPKGMDMAHRATMDGISMRFMRGYDIVNMRYVSRLDILYGFAAIRPKLAVRVTR
jgi:hypothetical protein